MLEGLFLLNRSIATWPFVAMVQWYIDLCIWLWTRLNENLVFLELILLEYCIINDIIKILQIQPNKLNIDLKLGESVEKVMGLCHPDLIIILSKFTSPRLAFFYQKLKMYASMAYILQFKHVECMSIEMLLLWSYRWFLHAVTTSHNV